MAFTIVVPLKSMAKHCNYITAIIISTVGSYRLPQIMENVLTVWKEKYTVCLPRTQGTSVTYFI